MAIQSFSDRDTERFYASGIPPRNAGWKSVSPTALRKLDMLHYAARIHDLASPPGNRLEALRGAGKGFWSVRINDRWRIMFRWTPAGPADVRITDYH
jgi:proteic killer suppression protein